ncbi:MAG: NUDIX hydrolase [Candidatus Zixiibacteriota bacterium]
MLKQLTAPYGTPAKTQFVIPVDAAQFERIKSSQKEGRKHDFTLYIIKDDKIVVIAKHFYPPGLYRPPSGGLRPGEDIHGGIKREAFEETGCKIELERFLLHSEVKFTNRLGVIEWDTFVFQARYLEGDFKFTDHREIREVRLASLDELEKFSSIMRQSTNGGWHYRAILHEAVRGLLRLNKAG